MVTLNETQKPHVINLMSKLETFGKAIDYSPTGAGKTFVSCYIMYQLQTQGKIDQVRVICPPSLFHNWKNVSSLFNVKNVSIHGYDKKKYPKNQGKCLLILDEFHLLKNTTDRYYRVKSFIETCEYTIGLSATPMDRDNHYDHYRDLFNGGIRKLKCSMGNLKLEVNQSIEYSHDNKTHNVNTYYEGYDMLSRVYGSRDRRFFTSRLYTHGLMTIHKSLYDNLIQICKRELKTNPNRKIIILESFSVITNRLMNDLKEFNPLLMNGSVSKNERVNMIEKFQEPSDEYRVMITSTQVGGVGISLDDTHGDYPRTTMVMPLGNYLDFKQALGRTLRTNTKSDSKVLVIQPHTSIDITYMKQIITKKGSVLDGFLE